MKRHGAAMGAAGLRASTRLGLLALLIAGLAMACGNGDEDEDSGNGGTDSDGADVSDGSGGADGSASDGGALADGQVIDVAKGVDTGSSKQVLTVRSLKFEDDLHGVWGSSADDVWWVGKGGRILHDNGMVLAPRHSGTDKDLYAVWGLDANNVWFVGDGVLLQWDGKKLWDRTPDDHKDTLFRAAHGPKDGSTLFVAGSGGTVLRYLPAKDTLMQEATGSGIEIHGIWAEGAGIVWAVGASGQALKLSGGSWSTTTMLGAGNRILNGIDGFKGRMYAVGDEGYVAATDPDLKSWNKEETNDPPPERDLRGVWAVSDKEAWAIGVKGALMHKTGKNWNRTDIDGAYMKTRSFNHVWGVGGSDGPAWAVGDGGAGLLFSEGQWLDYKAETTAHLMSIAALDDGRLVACGNSGLLLVAADAKSEFVDLGAPVTATDLLDVASDGKGGLIAVGKGGVVIAVTADGAMSASVPAASGGKNLTGVALVGGKPLAVGMGGLAMILDGGAWQAETTGVQWNWRAIGSAGGEAWVVGDNGQIRMRDASGKWSEDKSGTLLPLNRVVAWGKGEAAAVGDNGLLLIRSGGKWKSAFQEAALFLYGVTRRDDGTVIAVGWGGTLVVGQGETFKKVESGLFNVLRDIAWTPAGTVAVGYKGGVYQVAEKL